MFVLTHRNGKKSTQPVNPRKSEISGLPTYTFLEIADLPDMVMKLVIQVNVIDAEAEISDPFRRKRGMGCLLVLHLNVLVTST